jgi:hypothetical protein
MASSGTTSSWNNKLNNFQNKLPNCLNPNSGSCKLPQCQNCWGVYWIFLIVVIIILIYALILRLLYGKGMVYYDNMNKKLFTIPRTSCCSSWPISHLILFFILGFIFPDCLIIIIIAGVLWEVIESIAATLTSSERHAVRSESSSVQYSGNWFAASGMDIVMDLIGVFAGKFARIALDPYLPPSWQRSKKA